MMEHKSLREYIQLVESAQQVQAEDAAQVGNVVGQAGATAVNAATAAPRAIWDGMKWVYNKGADAVNSAVQGVQNFAGGVAQGFQTGGLDPLHPQASAQQAAQSYAQAGKPQQGAMPKQTIAPDELKKIQQQLGLKPDGVMGPKTQAAIVAFQQKNGLKADGVIGPKTQAALQGGQGATPTAPAQPQTQTQQNFAAAGMAGQEMRTPAEVAASADLKSANNAGNINAGLTPDDPRWKGPKPAAAPKAELTPQQQAQNVLQPGMNKVQENAVGYDEVQRIVSLVHYK
jgi:peptidoglycan hydrolase-like protein with peptidoglycan-binding domain